MSEALKLCAADEEDMRVLSACMQDGLLPFTDMQYLPDERRFVAVVNRFCWENCDVDGSDCECYERVNCGLCFDSVRAVRLRGLNQADRTQILELLAITAGAGTVTLIFAGGGAIRLEVDRILCRVQDLGEPWPTKWRPRHDLELSA